MRNTLTTRVVIVLALAAIIPTAVLGYLAMHHARRVLEREVVRGNLALIRALGASLDGTLQDARRTLELAAAWWADERTLDSVTRDNGATERLLGRLQRDVPLFSTLAVVDTRGGVIHGDPDVPDLGTAAHTFGGYIGDVTFEGDRPSVWMVAQARSRTGELVAVFVARLDLHFVAEALGQARLGPGARLLVVDGEGIPVARSDGAPVAGAPGLRGTNPAVDRALGQVTEGSLEAGGVVAVYRNLSSYQTLRGVRWAIILEQPTREAYALARTTRENTIRVGVSVLALSLLVGVLLAARLTRPLRRLAARADAIAGGMHGGPDGSPGAGGTAGDTPPAPVNAPGEIGVLAQRFEEMARRIGEREKLQTALARGDRLASVGTMAASVAHEVNNPLTTVLGYAKLLLEDKPPDHPDRAGLELIADEAARMKGIIGNLLDYSRSERAPRLGGSAELDAALRHTAALLVPQLRRARVTVDMHLCEALPPVAAHPHALQQVFVNLVQNAAQAMPEGGRIRIDSGRMPGDVAVEVRVTDQGPGVPPAERRRIFDPFITTKEAGTGLGLAVCKHLVTSFRGSIDVGDGPDGRGACFRVVIPIVEGES